MKYDAEVAAAVTHWSGIYRIPIDKALVHGIIEKETRHGALPLSHVEPDGDTSYGPMMVKAATARTVLGVSNPATLMAPAAGIDAGVHYLATRLIRYPGDTLSAIAAYNAGTAYRHADGTFANNQYVVDVLSFWNRFKRAVVAASPVALPVLAFAAILLLSRTRRRRAA